MPLLPRLHDTTTHRTPRPAPWPARLLALVLGGLLLVTFDCAALLHGADHAHGASRTAFGGAQQGVWNPEFAEPAARAASSPSDDLCASLGLDAAAGSRQASSDGTATAVPMARDAVPAVAAVSGAALLQGLRTRAIRAPAGRSTLTALCRWRT
ncbi:hypothetical protein ACWD6P_14855 [Streptomyces sp. NPDC002446]